MLKHRWKFLFFHTGRRGGRQAIIECEQCQTISAHGLRRDHCTGTRYLNEADALWLRQIRAMNRGPLVAPMVELPAMPPRMPADGADRGCTRLESALAWATKR